MLEDAVDTVAKQIYFLLQAMYMENEPGERMAKMIREFKRLTNSFVEAAPSASPIILDLHQRLLANDLYKAMRACRKLIAFERERLEYFENKIGAPSAADTAAGLPQSSGCRTPTEEPIARHAAESAGHDSKAAKPGASSGSGNSA